jgi:hypothetical protein
MDESGERKLESPDIMKDDLERGKKAANWHTEAAKPITKLLNRVILNERGETVFFFVARAPLNLCLFAYFPDRADDAFRARFPKIYASMVALARSFGWALLDVSAAFTVLVDALLWELKRAKVPTRGVIEAVDIISGKRRTVRLPMHLGDWEHLDSEAPAA